MTKKTMSLRVRLIQKVFQPFKICFNCNAEHYARYKKTRKQEYCNDCNNFLHVVSKDDIVGVVREWLQQKCAEIESKAFPPYDVSGPQKALIKELLGELEG